ncbi:hypothetical protein CL633_01885 [bacterium]|nr:hypothetical protein [bacterium]|tara:strand:- start:8877 stop:9791 length:915 start_codon:yes stop_codon:yes gene_type:complete
MKKIKTFKTTWVDIYNPKKEDIKYLEEKYNFHPLILEEIIPPSQRARVEQFDDQLYLVLYFPVFNKKTRLTKIRELDIIVSKKALISTHYKTILPVKALRTRCHLYEESRVKYMNRGPGVLLYHIIESLLKASLPKLDHITEKINKIEEKIFQGHEKDMVSEISIVKRDILNMAKAIKPQKSLINSLSSVAPKFFGSRYKIYFQDLEGSYDYVRSILDNQQEMINSLEHTNASLLSNKISEVMKVLTVVSFITFPLALIAGIFGMNVFSSHAFAKEPLTFWMILTSMLVLAGTMTIIFKIKKWL